MKAGMESKPGAYRWSSYLAYEKGGGLLTDTDYAEKLFGSRRVLIDFVNQSNDDQAMDETDNQWHVVDDEAKEIFLRVTNCDTSDNFKQISLPVKRECIKELYIQHLSIRQISDLTGLAKSTVYDVVRKINPEELLAELHETSFEFNSDNAERYGKTFTGLPCTN